MGGARLSWNILLSLLFAHHEHLIMMDIYGFGRWETFAFGIVSTTSIYRKTLQPSFRGGMTMVMIQNIARILYHLLSRLSNSTLGMKCI